MAFHFIFDELLTPGMSKMTAIQAKSTKIEVMQRGSKFLGKKEKRSAIAIRQRPNKADPKIEGMALLCWAFHFTYARAGELFSKS